MAGGAGGRIHFRAVSLVRVGHCDDFHTWNFSSERARGDYRNSGHHRETSPGTFAGAQSTARGYGPDSGT